MLDNNSVITKIDLASKRCKECKDKKILKGSDGFVPIWCPPTCELQIAEKASKTILIKVA